MSLPPWLTASLALPNLDDAAISAAADWLRPQWRAPPGGARRRSALAVARSPAEAAAAVAQLPFPSRAVLAALSAEPNASAHATTLAGILFAREGAEGTGIDAWERREGEREKDVLEAVMRGRSALLIVFENRKIVFGTALVSDDPKQSSACADFASNRVPLELRVEALEMELDVSQKETRRMAARVSEMEQNFEFWTRMLLAEMKTASAVDTAGRAALAEAIESLSRAPSSVLDPSNESGLSAGDGCLSDGKPPTTCLCEENSSKSCLRFEAGSSISLSSHGDSDGRRKCSPKVETLRNFEGAKRSEESIEDRAAQLLGIKSSLYRPSSSTAVDETTPTTTNEHHVFRDGHWRTVALPVPTARLRPFSRSRMSDTVAEGQRQAWGT